MCIWMCVCVCVCVCVCECVSNTLSLSIAAIPNSRVGVLYFSVKDYSTLQIRLEDFLSFTRTLTFSNSLSLSRTLSLSLSLELFCSTIEKELPLFLGPVGLVCIVYGRLERTIGGQPTIGCFGFRWFLLRDIIIGAEKEVKKKMGVLCRCAMFSLLITAGVAQKK
jgi:hypothetical protein